MRCLPARGIVGASRSVLGRVADSLRQWETVQAVVLQQRRWRAQCVERWLNIQTVEPPARRAKARTTFGDHVFYEATDYSLLNKYIRPLNPAAHDVVFDIGCGLGRTLCVFARRGVGACVGIEYAPELAQGAARNAARLRGRRAPIEIRTGDAAEADYSTGTIFWINNPFGAETLGAVIRRIECSLLHFPRRIQIAYIYPFHAHVLQSCPWLRFVHREQSIFHGTSSALYWVHEPSQPRIHQNMPVRWAPLRKPSASMEISAPQSAHTSPHAARCIPHAGE